MPPLIGISTSEMRAPERTRALAKGEPPTRELALGLSYPRSIEVAGAVPVVIPPLELDRIDALLARLGGLVISGGPDIHPAAYGEDPDPALGPTEPELDAFEIAMVRRADALGRAAPARPRPPLRGGGGGGGGRRRGGGGRAGAGPRRPPPGGVW